MNLVAFLVGVGVCGCGEDVLMLGKDAKTAGTLAVKQILLRNAVTGELVSDLASDVQLSIAALPSPELSLEAVVPNGAGSVEFIVDQNISIEHELPFTYPGDTNGKLDSFSAQVGDHRVTANPYSELGAQGERGASLSRKFTFVN